MKRILICMNIDPSTTGMVQVDWDFLKEVETVNDALACVSEDARTLSAWISDYAASHDVERRQAIKKSLLNQTFAYQIFAGTRRPTRDKLIQLAFGLSMAPHEASGLLEHGGVNALLPTCRRDVIIAFCLRRAWISVHVTTCSGPKTSGHSCRQGPDTLVFISVPK